MTEQSDSKTTVANHQTSEDQRAATTDTAELALNAEPDARRLEERYAGVNPAYQLAISSYDNLVKRLDAYDGRIQTILAFAASTTAVVPSVANANGLHFRSVWLYLALAAFAFTLLLGTYARLSGTVRLLNPSTLYEKWLHFSEWEFKKNFIYFAGKDFEANKALIEKKWKLSVAVSCLFFLEAVLLVVWVAVRA
jgi:hypothetical protein